MRHFAKKKRLFSHCNPATGSRPLSWSRSPSPPSCRTWQGNCHRSDHWCLLGPHVVSHARPGLGLFRRLDIGHFVLFELFPLQRGATNTCFYCTKTINAGSLENSLQFCSTGQHSFIGWCTVHSIYFVQNM